MNRRLILVLIPLCLACEVNAGDKGPEKPRRVEGVLKADDPLDPATKKPRQVHVLFLRGEQAYLITLDALDKTLDPFLRIEDAAGKELGRDDDGGGGLNSRLFFLPPKDGDYKVIATAFEGTGKYLLRVAPVEVHAVGKDGLKIEGKIDKTDPPLNLLRGAPHQVFLVRLEKGQNYVFELKSKEFDAFLFLQDAAGKVL